MNIADLLSEERIVADLHGTERAEVLAELSTAIVSGIDALDPEEIRAVLTERERLGSTAIGAGVAIPHGKMDGLPDVLAGFGRSKSGVDFGAPDGTSSNFFFVLMAPVDCAGTHLKCLARIARLARDPDFRAQLGEAGGAGDILALIKSAEAEL